MNPDVLFQIKKILEAIFPAIFSQVAKVGLDPRARLLKELKEYYFQHGHRWNKINLGVIRYTEHPKAKQVFNDYLYLATEEKIELFLCTSEPGKRWTASKKEKYGVSWVGLYPIGNYEKNYKLSTFRKMPALRQVGKVKLMNVETGKFQMGGGCHLHGRTNEAGETVGFASAGCVVPKSNSDLETVVDTLKVYFPKREQRVDFTVIDRKSLNMAGIVV